MDKFIQSNLNPVTLENKFSKWIHKTNFLNTIGQIESTEQIFWTQ